MSARLPFSPDLPSWAMAAVLGVVVAGTAAISTATDDPKPRPAVADDDLGFDCRTQGNRVCGSDVVWQVPGIYPAPDGGTYRVVEVSPHEACLSAANVPGPSGFAPEVCEPLSPFFEPSAYVYTGPDTWSVPGAEVSVPSLAAQVADACPEAEDGVEACVEALIRERQEHPR